MKTRAQADSAAGPCATSAASTSSVVSDSDISAISNCLSDLPEAPAPLDESQRSGLHRATELREAIAANGLEFHGFLKTEATSDFRSGLSSDGTDYRGLLETSVSLDLAKAVHWTGARASFSFHDYFGSNGSNLIDDAQGFSNIDSTPANRIYELWFEQSFGDGKLRLKAGRVDANTEFAYVENATDFLNASMGFSPTILGLNTYPAPRTGGLAELKLFGSATLTAGDFRCPIHGNMALAEAARRWKVTHRSLPGRAAFGFWIHPHTREGFMGTTAFGVRGYYLIVEQALWSTGSDSADHPRGVRSFFQWGDADPMFSGIARHLGGGMEWVGPFQARQADAVGFGITNVRLGQDYFGLPASGSERSIESFYKLCLRPSISITADMQFLASSPLALTGTMPYVATLRLSLVY